MAKCPSCKKSRCRCAPKPANSASDEAAFVEPPFQSSATSESTQVTATSITKDSTEVTPKKSIEVVAPSTPVKGTVSSDTSTTATAPAGTAEPVEPVPVEMTSELFIKFSEEYLNGFAVPTYSSVAVAAMGHFQQEGMICKPMRVSGDLVFKFVLRKEVPKEGHELEFFFSGKSTKVPLYAFDREKEKKNRREGTLITFKGAAEGPPRCVAASAYDAELEAKGLALIVPTRLQKVKFTQVFNGNRFCIIDTPEDMKKIPEYITVRSPQDNKLYNIKTTFKGQEIFCDRCQINHVGPCPELQAFYEAKRMRKTMVEQGEISTKIYSDSTMRNVDALGLRAEVCAMSGGGLGQVIQASLDDPENINNESVVIIGGTNDCKQQNFVNTEQFAANIDLSLTKLANAAQLAPDRTFYLGQQLKMVEETGTDEEEQTQFGIDSRIRELYLQRRIREISDKVQNVEMIELHYNVDETGHPSDSGTIQILTALHNSNLSIDPLIWNSDFILSEKPYRHIQSIFRYGCNLCTRYGTDMSRKKYANQLVCDDCWESTILQERPTNQVLQEITERLKRLESKRSVGTTGPPQKRSKDGQGEEEKTR
jgi:hypothetical protein